MSVSGDPWLAWASLQQIELSDSTGYVGFCYGVVTARQESFHFERTTGRASGEWKKETFPSPGS